MRSRRRRLWSWMVQTVIIATLLSAVLALPEVIKIGGLFETTEEQQELAFRYAIDMINSDMGILPKSRLSAQARKVAPQDSFRALKTACDFMEEGVAAIFGAPSPSTTGVLQASCDALQVPLIQTHWDYLSRVRSHAINLFPHTHTLATAFTELIKEQHWKSFTLIYEDNEALIRLQELVKTPSHHKIKVTLRHVKPDDNFKKVMKDLWKQRENNFVVDLSLYKVRQLFQDANKVEMMSEYQNYLLTSLDIHTVEWDSAIVGKPNITAFRLVDPENPYVNRVVKDWIFSEKRQGRRVTSKQPLLTEAALLYDGVVLLAKALEELDGSQPIDLKSLYCDSTNQWHHGSSIVNYMKMIPRHGLTGEIKLDKNGQRSSFSADIVKLTRKGIPVKIGTWDPKDHVKFLESATEDTGDILKLLENATLRVTTILTTPYIIEKEPKDKFEGNDRFEGFVVDIIQGLSELYKFKYIISPVKDKSYGSKKNGVWNGMIGELLRREADIAIADLTITSAREEAVDFTLPFMNLGISILFKKPEKQNPPLFSFLQPLSLEVWFFMATAFLGVSLFMFILARLSPYEWVNPHPCDTENDVVENQFSLLNSFWFVIGSIMQQGSDLLPRAISTRIVASSWWFFTLIMISSYTANLAAFLTAQRMKSPIESAADLAKQTTIKYGCVLGGSTAGFFKDSDYPTYKRMWSFMESERPSVFADGNEQGIKRVKMGNYAFLMESTTIEYITAGDCGLMKIGGELDTKGYGIATPPGSPYRTPLSSGVLHMQEMGKIHTLRDQWWKKKGNPDDKCQDDGAASSNEMGVANVKGVFLVLFIGMALGVIIVLIEFIWKAKKQLDRESIPVMLYHELRHIMACRGSTRPVSEEPEEASVEKLPMVALKKTDGDNKYS